MSHELLGALERHKIRIRCVGTGGTFALNFRVALRKET